MDHSRRPPSLHITTSSPALVSTSGLTTMDHSHSPFRYVHFEHTVDEKTTPITSSSSQYRPGPSSTHHPPCHALSLPVQDDSLASPSCSPISGPSSRMLSQPTFSLCSRLRLMDRIRPWIPVLMYGATSLGFLIAIAFYKTQVFTFLDELSSWLKNDRYGYAILYLLIFITTFPPVPMYSTLIILSGYTFGPWIGAIISYFAALTGALTVFIISRTMLRTYISNWLSSACSMKRVVCAIEKRPKLLFLIRLAPYPYNVMNCLLAAAPSLTFGTFTLCTALSLFKVIVHTSLGASIHSFKDYHVSHDEAAVSSNVSPTSTSGSDKPEEEESGASTFARTWTIVGVVLCIAIFVYLSYVARKAVNEELEGESSCGEEEERVAFLSPRGVEDLELGLPDSIVMMTESSIRSSPLSNASRQI